MAFQSRMTDHFLKRKRSDLQPSKRRKVQVSSDLDFAAIAFGDGAKTEPSSAGVKGKKEVDIPAGFDSVDGLLPPEPNNNKTTSIPASEKTVQSVRNKTVKMSKQTTRGRRSARNVNKKNGMTVLDNFLLQNQMDGCSSSDSGIDQGCSDSVTTAIEDDHLASLPSTPQKKISSKASESKVSKRVRAAKTVKKVDHLTPNSEATPLKGYDFEKFAAEKKEQKETPAKKKLIMKRGGKANQESGIDTADEKSTKQSGEAETEPGKDNTECHTPIRNKVIDILERTPEVLKEPSPLAQTKQSSKMELPSPRDMRAKLSKSGKLQELQERLLKMHELKKQGEKQKQKMKVEAKEKAKEVEKSQAPAYERYHTLATEVPPGLNLPYKYKALEELFRGADTILSMLHNRSEVCTFSKLKKSVQELNRKTFEQKHLAQISHTYPKAYIYRQERGLPDQTGRRTNNYQLSIEIDFTDIDEGTKKSGRQLFTPSMMLKRRKILHAYLVEKVKRHHKIFLSTLTPAVDVPDEKLQRWHPKFQVDQIPDLELAALPEPPNVVKLKTAQDVLERAKIAKDARLQSALEHVIKKKGEQPTQPKTPPLKHFSSALKGVPQSLLEKIRAKEAKRIESSMLMKPEQQRREERLARLPELVKILRNVFITEKKPTMLLDVINQRLADSYKSVISLADIEDHTKLMLDLLPEWITLIKIQKGTFLKIDKNKDLGVLDKKLGELLHQSKMGKLETCV